jgi:hypothetical protein
MQTKGFMRLNIILLALLVLSACSQPPAMTDWEKFAIEEAPRFDIQFLVPPDWNTNYILPMETAPGQWKVILTPPRCTSDQSEDYIEECITMTAYVKGEAEFNEDEVLALISQSIPLDQEGRVKSILIGQNSYTIDGLSVQRFNHKIASSNDEVQLSCYYFQTENAYYTIMADFPYDERDGEAAQTFQAVLNSIEVVE